MPKQDTRSTSKQSSRLVLFLDFDGVLNSEASFRWEIRKKTAQVNNTLSPIACSNLQYVLDKCPELKIVISSTWRLLHTMDELKAKLAEYGVDSSRVIDQTPNTFSRHRGREIGMWLEDHPEVERFVVLDDDRDAHVFDDGNPDNPQRSLSVQTDWFDGLLIGDAYRIVTFVTQSTQHPAKS